MTPRCLTTGSIRSLPGTPPPARKHGPITGLVRKERCGTFVYEGFCDGDPVCIAEFSPGKWRASTRDATLREGTLVEVLGVKEGDKWRTLRGAVWMVDEVVAPNSVTFRLTHGSMARADGLLSTALELGWRPEAMP